MEEEEKDDNNDILTKFAHFVDSNLRIFRVRKNINYNERNLLK